MRNLPNILLLMIFLLSACSSPVGKEIYEHPEEEIKLEKPQNWEVSYSERNGITTLKAEKGLWNKASAVIEIRSPTTCQFDALAIGRNVEDVLNAEIDRIGGLYDLESVNVTQDIAIVETRGYEIAQASIAIPTLAMDDDSRNQMGSPAADKYQPVDLFVFRKSDYYIYAFVYQGKSDILNTEAQEIVDSIELTCNIQP